MTSLAKTEEEVLLLPESQRADLAAKLLDSLGYDPAERMTDDEWMSEIERRAARAIDGEPGIPWDEVEVRVREKLSPKK